MRMCKKMSMSSSVVIQKSPSAEGNLSEYHSEGRQISSIRERMSRTSLSDHVSCGSPRNSVNCK